LVLALLPLAPLAAACAAPDAPAPPARPNVVFFLADDLGYGEVGAYGQTKIKTPNIDRLAAEGMRFTDFYSGSPVCAPARGTLMTGLHTGHAFVRDNKEMGGWEKDDPEGQLPLPAGTVTLPATLRDAGYATAAIGKWGLGGPGSTGQPNLQGFDHWFGYLCQRWAHNYYPDHLWRNQERYPLENEYFSAHQRLDAAPDDPAAYDQYRGPQYAPDLMIEDALAFIRENRDRPFFLYFATPVPHAALQVPADSLEPYLQEGWDEAPYLGQKGYLPHPAPRAAYAAMVSRMDRDFGRILALLAELGLDDRTLVMFSSDNGPTFNGGTDSTFFESAGPLRGLKQDVYEGGIRVPFIARWPGKVAAGATSALPAAFWDVLPTLADVTGAPTPPGLDGVSIAPTLLNEGTQPPREYLYWEFQGNQAVRLGDWKAYRMKDTDAVTLYDLATDIGETRDVAADHPDVVARVTEILRTGRTESAEFPLRRER
jgi:arylsulfatase